jgi:hypothetical protein
MQAFAFINTHPWAYPAREVFHLVGIALLLGNLVLIEVRVWGGGASLDLAELSALSLKLVFCGFALAAISGLLMFAAQPQELISNRSFIWKMGLLMLAGCNAAAFHARGGFARLDAWAKTQLGVSVLLWITIMFCGRWIAYV